MPLSPLCSCKRGKGFVTANPCYHFQCVWSVIFFSKNIVNAAQQVIYIYMKCAGPLHVNYLNFPFWFFPFDSQNIFAPDMDLNFPFIEMNSEQVSFEGFQKKWGIPIAGWFLMDNPIKMGWFSGTPIFGNLQWSKIHPARLWNQYLELHEYSVPIQLKTQIRLPNQNVRLYIYIHTYKLDCHDPRTANPYWTAINLEDFPMWNFSSTSWRGEASNSSSLSDCEARGVA